VSARLLSRLHRSVRSAWHVARGVVGETAYERYLEHHRRHHPDVAPLAEREFWRRHVDRGDHSPGARCC
jgi:uncharacterized short protein YbdD (DUF466 family)